MPAAPAIRPATEDDLAAIQRIYAHHVLHGLASFEESAPSVDEMRTRFRTLAKEGRPYLVAVVDGRVVGYAYAGPYRTRSAYRYTVENSVYVEPGLIGRGVGSALLEALIAACERGPWRQMLAVIGDSANTASIALHRKHGFVPLGVLAAVGFKHGRWVDSVVMQRTLGAGGDKPPDDAPFPNPPRRSAP